jgi:two-component system, LuxR family, sensor kinase FixL
MSKRLSRTLSGPTSLRVALMLAGVAAIFTIDTFTPLDIEIAVLYAVVVIASADFLGQRGILLVCAVCVLQTLLSYAIVHGDTLQSEPVLRALVSLCAIGIATLAALRNRGAAENLSAQAALLDLTHDAIFVRDRNDVITFWNAGAEQLYGWPRKEALGQEASSLLKTKYPPSAGATEQPDHPSRWQGELIHTRRDGREVWVVSRWAVQRDERGRPVATMETNSDITVQKQAEDALHHARSQLEHITRVSTLGELTASIAHEVNQPLAAIMTNGEAGLRWPLRDEPNLEEVRQAVERTIANGRRASEVIARLRALARKSNPSHTVLTLNDIVADVVPLMEREMLNNHVALRLDLQAPAPSVLGDRARTGRHQSCCQCHSCDVTDRGSPTAVIDQLHDIADGIKLPYRRPGNRGHGSGHRSEESRQSLCCLPHDKSRRNGHGALDQPHDR